MCDPYAQPKHLYTIVNRVIITRVVRVVILTMKVISMIYEQELCEKKIQGIEFKFTLCLYLKVSKLEIDGNPVYVQDVDIAQIVRAIMTSSTVLEVAKGVTNTWTEEDIKATISERMRVTAGVL